MNDTTRQLISLFAYPGLLTMLGLGLLAPDIFRPALDKALHQSALAREAVDAAAALKQHEAQQRAQLGGDLDSGVHNTMLMCADVCSLLTSYGTTDNTH